MTSVKVLIRKNIDLNYDRLFAALDRAAVLGGKCASLSETDTPAGLVVELPCLPDAVRDWLDGRKDITLA